jgi:hypothetical protein
MRCDISRRFDGVASEQFSPASQQRANFVELLLQRRISHVVTLPRARRRHNSLGVPPIPPFALHLRPTGITPGEGKTIVNFGLDG